LFDTVRSFADDTFEASFQLIVDELSGKKDAQKREVERLKEEELKQQELNPLVGKNWSQEDIKQLTLGIVKFPAGTGDRWKVIAEFVGKSQKEVISKAKEIQARQLQDVEARRKEEQDKQDKLAQLKKEAALKQAKEQNTTKAPAAPSTAPTAAPSNDDVWTNDQQKQMENGMREFGADLPTKERWIKIAERVDGKSAKQCYERFKDLCAKAKSK